MLRGMNVQRLLTLTLAVCAVTTGLASRPVKADPSAVAHLKPYVDAARRANAAGQDYYIDVTLVGHEPNGSVSYTREQLKFYEYSFGTRFGGIVRVQGFQKSDIPEPGNQWFSDRIAWVRDPADFDTGFAPAAPHPFDPDQADRLGFDLDTRTGKLTVIQESWGGRTGVIDLMSANGVLLAPSAGGAVTMSVREWVPPPPLH